MPQLTERRDIWIRLFSAALLVAGVCATSFSAPKLFHTLAEGSFVAVGYAAFVMAWNLRRFSDDDFFLFVSRALVVVGVLQLLHALTYPGVGVLPGASADLSSQFALAAGLLAGCAFVLAPFTIGRRLNPVLSMWVFWVIGAVLVGLIGWSHVVPAAHAADGSLTPFASTLAVVDALLLVAAIGSLLLCRRGMGRKTLLLMIAALAALAVYEAGMLFADALGRAPDVGRHVLLMVSALCIYYAVVMSGLTRPIALAVDDLERRRHAADARYAALIEQSPMGVFVVDGDATIVAVNESAAQILGASREALVGMSMRDARDRRFFACVKRALEGSPSSYEGPHVSRFTGSELWVAVRAAPLAGEDGDHAGCIVAVVDLTSGKRAEELAEHLTFRDSLTGLANRTLLRDRLGQALLTAARLERRVALVALDLDRFKVVNDTLGSEVGDELLVAAGARLTAALRSDDTAARTGPDEFLLVLPGIGSTEDAVTATEKIAEAMRRPWGIRGHVFHTTATLGVALYPEDGDDPDALIEHAHAAMRRAKQEGGAACQYFSSSMNVHAEGRLELESDLRRALITGCEFDVFCQPQVSLGDGRLVGLEALVRWRHPVRGILAPDAFVPLAETIGLIGEIDRLVLTRACRLAADIRDELGLEIRMAVNVSAREFRRDDIARTVRDALRSSGLAPERLELEVTETVAMTDIGRASQSMQALTDMGVTLALDDFGTGFSSLAHLRELPITRLKIDRSFVGAMLPDASTATIVASVIALGQSLGMTVLAEGVETSDQANALRDLGCREAQGYLYARPMCAEALGDYLRAETKAIVDQELPKHSTR